MVTLLIAYTGLREYIPGYPSGQQRRLMIRNMIDVDSLVNEINKRDNFILSIKAAISGENVDSIGMVKNNFKRSNKPIHLKNSEEDKAFRDRIEKDEKFNLSTNINEKDKLGLNQIHFYAPIKGIITKKYLKKENHLGIDIVSKNEETVMSILDGTVIFTEWSVQTGYVIIIQHENNLISAYKHNSILLKRQGEKVKAGEAIAHVGNSGELTTGPHLHFELWYNGVPLNVNEYISFE